LADLAELPAETVAALQRLAARSHWDMAAAFRAARPRSRAKAWKAAGEARPAQLQATGRPVHVAVDDLEALLRPGGALAERMGAFEDRPGQRAMLRRVAEALNWGDQLLVEAGTG